uniref:Apolipoprotein C-II n=1 Tax=Monodelphis domestica TaxID=13616 RepID=A0A5F8GIY3_MONDO
MGLGGQAIEQRASTPEVTLGKAKANSFPLPKEERGLVGAGKPMKSSLIQGKEIEKKREPDGRCGKRGVGERGQKGPQGEKWEMPGRNQEWEGPRREMGENAPSGMNRFQGKRVPDTSSNLTPSTNLASSSCHHGCQEPPSPYLLPAAGAAAGLSPGCQVPDFDGKKSPTMLSKFQSQLYGYWESAKAKAHQIYEKVQIPPMDQNIRHAYNKGSEAMTTYTGILTDQIIHLLKGDQ